MDGFVILVEFRLKPGARHEFIRAARADAEGSVGTEPGCRRFDIVLPEDDPDSVWLYEIYTDQKAFDSHLETPHLAAFREATADLVESSSLRRCGLIETARR